MHQPSTFSHFEKVMQEPATPWENAPLDKKTFFRSRFDDAGNELSRPSSIMQSWVAAMSMLVLVIIFLVIYVGSEAFWVIGILIFVASFMRESKEDFGKQPKRSGNYERIQKN
jgi:hypothetical protein